MRVLPFLPLLMFNDAVLCPSGICPSGLQQDVKDVLGAVTGGGLRFSHHAFAGGTLGCGRPTAAQGRVL